MVSRERPAAAEAAEAEATAAEAEARAAAARAHAIRLRRQTGEAHLQTAEKGEEKVTAKPDDSETAASDGTTAAASRRHPAKIVAVAAAIVLLCVSLAASGYLLWHHRVVAAERQHRAEFAAAAREAVVTFMSLDVNNLGEDIQRITDITTGQFKDRFPIIGDQMAKRVQESKMVTTAKVNEVAVESMTANSAIVLVAATGEAKGPEGAQEQEPQFWHIALGLTEDGGTPKISNIEFVQ
jgi:Mce-associated membrane protein